MEDWIAVLAIIGAVVSLVQKAQKKSREQEKKSAAGAKIATGAKPAAGAKGVPPVHPETRRQEWTERMPGTIEARQLQQAFTQWTRQVVEWPPDAKRSEPEDLPEGDSRADGHDIGGSMPHMEHQGVEFAGHDHGGKLANSPARLSTGRFDRPEEETGRSIKRKPSPAARFSGMTPGRMRSAVVMAELIGKPIALRKGGYRG